MSGRCDPPVNGSLTMTTSPSSTRPTAAIVASTERSIEPRCTGTCSACATSCAAPSKIAQEASIRSLMFGEKDVRFSTAPISSAIDSSALRSTSRVTGSMVLRRVTSFMRRTHCERPGAGDLAAGDPAVNDQLGAGDVARRVGGEKQDAIGDVLRLADPPERRAAPPVFFDVDRRVAPAGGEIGPDLAPDRRVDDARVHRVDPDAVLPGGALHRDRLGEEPHPALGRAIPGQGRRAAQPGDRRGHDDRPATRAAHQRDAVFDREEYPVEVDRGLPPPIRQAHLDDRGRHDADPGIGHHDVEPAVTPFDLGHDLLPAPLVGHVMRQVDRVLAGSGDLRRQRRAAQIVDVADDDSGALARQRLDTSRANPRRPAGDDRYFSVYLAHGPPLYSTAVKTPHADPATSSRRSVDLGRVYAIIDRRPRAPQGPSIGGEAIFRWIRRFRNRWPRTSSRSAPDRSCPAFWL